MNSISDTADQLIPVDYTDFLKKLTSYLKQSSQPIFTLNARKTTITIHVDGIAKKLVEEVDKLPNPVQGNTYYAKAATIHFSENFKKNFSTQIKQLQDQVRKSLEETTAIINQTPASYINTLTCPLTAFNSKGTDFGLDYSFDRQETLEKERLSFRPTNNSALTAATTPLLNLHRLTITVKGRSQDLNDQLIAGISNFTNTRLKPGASDAEIEDLEDLVKEFNKKKTTNPDFAQLRELVNKEGLGKLKKEAKLCYLEFLLQQAGDSKPTGKVYLEDLIRRLRSLESYINREDLPDSHFEIPYNGQTFNLRALFAREDAFDTLPIIPIIEGYLGETTDEKRDEISFIFGLKIKLNGKVNFTGKDGKALNTFNYYLSMLDLHEASQAATPDANKITRRFKQFNAEKTFRVVVLYYWVFNNFGDLDYNPQSDFEEYLLTVLRQNQDTEKGKRLVQLKNHLLDNQPNLPQNKRQNIQVKLIELKTLLKSVLKRQTALEPADYPVDINLRQGILLADRKSILRTSSFFQPSLHQNPKQALQYLLVGKSHVGTGNVLKLKANLSITNPQFSKTGEKQGFTLRHNIDGIFALPVVLTPRNEAGRKVYETFFKKYPLLIMPYDPDFIKNSSDANKAVTAFYYHFAYMLLSYTCLKVILEVTNNPNLFVPIVRLHMQGQPAGLEATSEDSFIRNLSKVLAHMLSEEARVNSQGFDIGELSQHLQKQAKPSQPKRYDFTVPNGLSSLYSVLPRYFEFEKARDKPALSKLAVIVVSSRKSDLKTGDDYHISTLFGEVIGLEGVGEKGVQVQSLRTFSANYSSDVLFREPTVLLDEMTRLYNLGYRHCVYIAKSPYSSTLHLTRKAENEDEELFFLSRNIVKGLKLGKADLKIYPVFFDKYPVVRLTDPKMASLYIQDIQELSQLVEDPAQRSVVFFNLFNGRMVGSTDERHYNGVVSYSTLLNMYKNILDEQEIRQGLIAPGSLRDSILQYLTLLHFARFEKARDISLKLDPYEGIIGTDSVGALATLPHISGYSEFSMLAFLVEVRRVLNVNILPSTKPPQSGQTTKTGNNNSK